MKRAGEGNRTLVFSLEGYCSTVELHPRFVSLIGECLNMAFQKNGLALNFFYVSILGCANGECRIRTCEGAAIRFTV